MTYEEQLKHPKWLEKRSQILQRDWNICQHCMSPKNLQVHHKRYYNDGRMAWEYPSFELITLCGDCHKEFHRLSETSVVPPETYAEKWERVRRDIQSLIRTKQNADERKAKG